MSAFSKIFSVTNKKGGVGKTTSTLNLAAALHAAGKKILVIDNDHQGNLTAASGIRKAFVSGNQIQSFFDMNYCAL